MDIDLKYASFWRRLGAGVIDFLLAMVFSALVGWMASLSKNAAYVLLPFMWLSMILYAFVLHAMLGATLGKIVLRIRVVDIHGNRISWRHSLARSSVDLAANAWWLLIVVPAAFALPPDAFQGQGYGNLFQIIKQQFPASYESLNTLICLWSMSEFVTMMLNRKRRAIHDYIGGTVVIYQRGLPNLSVKRDRLTAAPYLQR